MTGKELHSAKQINAASTGGRGFSTQKPYTLTGMWGDTAAALAHHPVTPAVGVQVPVWVLDLNNEVFNSPSLQSIYQIKTNLNFSFANHHQNYFFF